MRICDKPGCAKPATITVHINGRMIDEHLDACDVHAEVVRQSFSTVEPQGGAVEKPRGRGRPRVVK